MDELVYPENLIFEILNCYVVDARNITNGITYLDSSDAKRIAKAIVHTLKVNDLITNSK